MYQTILNQYFIKYGTKLIYKSYFIILFIGILSCNNHFSLTAPYTVDKGYVKEEGSCFTDEDCLSIKAEGYDCTPETGDKCVCDKDMNICQNACQNMLCPSDSYCDSKYGVCQCNENLYFDEQDNKCVSNCKDGYHEAEENGIKFCEKGVIIENFELSLGANHTCAIKNGKLYCWGSNDKGKIGVANDNNEKNYNLAQRIGNDIDWLKIANSINFSCALKGSKLGSDANLYCWGKGQTQPLKMGSKKDWNKLLSSWYKIFLLDKDGVLYIQSDENNNIENKEIQKFLSEENDYRWLGISSFRHDFADFAVGFEYNFCGIKQDKTLWCGKDSGGTQTIQKIGDKTWKQISAGFNHFCGIDSNDNLYCFGKNDKGQLGIGNFEDSSSLETKINLENSKWLTVSASYKYTCGIELNTNKLYCWGDNEDNQFGAMIEEDNNTCGNCNSPMELKNNIEINILKIISNYSSIIDNRSYMCIIDANTNLYCLGHNEFGQLGLGDNWLNNESCSENGSVKRCDLPNQVIISDEKK